ncbi:hypothetical protein [Fuchsiella alkaliacetigena]|uniref:hypothetical protein n=1 Tax=Fuchsiella alkaliacetigena TaxID=957042 RepID=UPI00200B864B|nr:hypothetical protein [Fuchsiella alkaliacetigena]MCK8825847.1 hypothetical protein [Fuchsiella alkaliacetigena]
MQKKKLNLVQVVKEGFDIYKEKFKVLLAISVIYFLVRLVPSAINHFAGGEGEAGGNVIVTLISSLLIWLIGLVFIYIQAKIIIAFYLCISGSYTGQQIGLKESFSSPRKLVLRFLILVIQLFAILVLPFITLIAVYHLVEIVTLKYIIIALLAALIVYLAGIYGLAPIIGILEDQNYKQFSDSKKLVKDNVLKVIGLRYLGIIFSIPYYYYTFIFGGSDYLIYILNQFLFIFLTPLIYAIIVAMYYQLKEIAVN